LSSVSASATAVAIIVTAVVVVTKIDAEDRAPGAARGELRNLAGRRVGVPGRSEEEGAELRVGQPSHVFRPLERRGTRRLGCRGCDEGRCIACLRLVDGNPFDRPARSRRVQLQLRRRNDVADDIGRMERDRAAVDDDLERLQLADRAVWGSLARSGRRKNWAGGPFAKAR
jgi:hypothetical protein